ncbi:hypothetical protein AB0G55_06320 [Streptomyces toyocaensis]|uniref:hypothetical protein n=1 Tax=Streptomyces toyocaensis TaxID=55952 RepID=UPI0012FF2AA2|nr:hypothetical protein [Streptomyces toyocaensis]
MSTTTVVMGHARRRPARIEAASVRQRATSVTWCGKRRTAVGHQPEANARRPAAATAAAAVPVAASTAGTAPAGPVTPGEHYLDSGCPSAI